MTVDVAVVGAGAAGLMAAIFAARGGARVAVLEGAPRIGAKILISGGGRCNVTHDVVSERDFNGSRNVIARVLRTFPVEETVAFFSSCGVELKREEGGKLFPVGDRARSVVDALVRAAEEAGATVRTGHRVTSIEPGFRIAAGGKVVETAQVILATGGRSVPKTGSDGFGYDLATSLGHSVTETFPALVPLVIQEGHWVRSSSGTSAQVELSVATGKGRILQRASGSMLLTHFGLSGPVVLDVSRHWIAARAADPEAALRVSFLPGQTFESVEQRLLEAARGNARATVASVLRGEVADRILAAIAPAGPLAKMPRDQRREAIRALVDQPLPISRDRGFEYAEVTAGGVPLAEVDPSTMASRRCDGLFLCGEILDVDGRIGGYNFQWAWASGRLAGTGTAVALPGRAEWK